MSTVAEFDPTYTPPGISWTAPEKSRPWLNPPQYVSVQDVCGYYIGVLSDENITDSMLDAIDTGVPLIAIAEATMLNSVANGVHTLDAGILAMPVIIEMLISVAEMDGIDYDIFPEDAADREKKPSARQVKLAIKKAMEQKPTMEEEPVAEETARGLMTKPNKGV